VPPTGGEGGNVAIRDAAALVKHLTKVVNASDQNEALRTEIREYEKDMATFSRSKVNKASMLCRIMTAEGIFSFIVRWVMWIVDLVVGINKV
jgi:2-polyprenyl-6-methoxyphenol hydroxylase-like FAD-dependent oxidoreductase